MFSYYRSLTAITCILIAACSHPASAGNGAAAQPMATADPIPPRIQKFTSSANCSNYVLTVKGTHIRAHPEVWRQKSEIDEFTIKYNGENIKLPDNFTFIPSTDKIIALIPKCIETEELDDFITVGIILKRTERTTNELGYSFRARWLSFKEDMIVHEDEEEISSEAILAELQ